MIARIFRHSRAALLGLALAACASSPETVAVPAPATGTLQPATATQPTAADARAFVDSASAVLMELGINSSRASWIQATYITHDSEILAAQANEAYTAAAVALAKQAARFNDVDAEPAVRRQLDALRLALSAPAPSEPAKTAEVAKLAAAMESMYGSGEYCPQGAAKGSDACLDLGELSTIMAKSRKPDSLLMAWTGWRTVSPQMKDEYVRFAELLNEGARELGFADAGQMWRSKYDMDPDAFAAEVDRLWEQVKPLYTSLHCYVRAELGKKYGFELVPQNGPIPAHLLGNMWAQQWGNIYDLVAPKGADPGYDLTKLIEQKKLDAREMTRYGERFFTSLGFDPLPQTFWDRSLFTKPADRDVVCHASAWNVDEVDDLRIKMCIEPNAEDFQTIHHELGHNFYQRAYNQQPYLFRNSANDGFHEALGDAVALSVTPSYLVQVGLLDREPPASKDIGLLLTDALDKVAFLPFGLLVDQWRWKVFNGEITPDEYNAGWWELREKYQGVTAPVARTEADFDPGAKYHVPGNTPYTRYFLAHILQFQMHRALCAAAGYEGPLNRCSIYGNEEAGRRLDAMMKMGASQPWPVALEALTGSREMDATAILDYFAPLQVWLNEQNRGRQCGW